MSTEDLGDRGALHDDGAANSPDGAGRRSDFQLTGIGAIDSSAFGDGSAVNNGLLFAPHHLQMINHWQAEPRVAATPGGGFKSVAESLAEQLREVFVEPAELPRARHVLGERNAVLLAGPAGSGRRAAAVRLLDELGDEHGRIVENDSGSDENDSRDGGNGTALMPGEEDVVGGARILVNLSAADTGAAFCAVNSHLDGLRLKARERGAFLVVVLPEWHGEFDQDFGRLLVQLRAPSPERVLQRHLEVAGVLPPPGGAGSVPLGEVQLREHLATWSMGRVGRFVGFIRMLREKEPHSSVEKWFQDAYGAVTRHAAEVARQVAESAPWQRALLLSAAMMPGSSVDAVYVIAAHLQERLHTNPGPLDPLRDRGVEADLDEIGVNVDSDRRVRFSLLGYDTAVRTYFWSNYPGGVRDSLRDWVRDCVVARELADEDRARLVDGFVEQAVRVRRAGDVCAVVQHWCESSQSRPELMQSAGNALAGGLLSPSSPEAAREILEQLYMWARGSKPSRALGRVLVDVCARVVVRDRPTAAITRLRLLAAWSDTEVAESARQSMVELAADARLCRRFLSRTQVWLAEDKAQWRSSDVVLFLHVVDAAVLSKHGRSPHVLDGEKYVRKCLVDGWRRAWQHDRERARGYLPSWFAAAAASVRGEPRDFQAADQLLKVLVEAVAGAEWTGLAQLYVRARDWAAAQGTERSHVVYDIVADQVDRAAGIQWDSEENRW